MNEELPQWPAALPAYPLRAGLQIEPLDNLARSPTDTGPGTQRPRSRREFIQVQCRTKLATRELLDTLLAFHRDTLSQGALRFAWPGLTDNLRNGDYAALQFAGKPQWQPAGATAWLVTLDLIAIPADPGVGLVDDNWLSAFATLDRNETLDYYDAAGDPQTAPIDTPAYDYHPSTLKYRGLKLGDADNLTFSTDFLLDGAGTLIVGTEPASTAAGPVLTLNDGSTDNQVQLAIDGAGNYVFTVRAGGVEVASLDTGVPAELLVRKHFRLTWGDNAFRAVGSGGAVVTDDAGAAPTGLATFAAAPGQWLQPLRYVRETTPENRMAAAAEIGIATEVSVADASAGESAAELVFQVTRIGDKSTACSVDYATADGTATAGEDYTATAGTLNYAAGETVKTVHVPLSPDTDYEGDETLALSLSNPVNCAVAAGAGTATGIITEDDPAPVLAVQATALSFDEDAGNAVIVVEKTGATEVDASVDYQTQAGTAVDGVDYVGVDNTLTIPAGQATGQILVPLIDRSGLQGDRTFDVVLSNPVDCTLGDDTATVTVQDPPEISVDDPVATEGTDPNLVFTLTRAGRSTGACSVQVDTQDGTATAGQDYTAVTALVVNFADGETQKTVQVPVINDDAYENNQTATLQLSNPSGCSIADASGIGTITSEDAPPVVSVQSTTYDVAEDAGTLTVKLVKTGNTEVACSVDWQLNDGTATAGTDYTDDSDTATFAAGETEKDVVIAIADRAGLQGDRDFDLVISAPTDCTLGDATATVTIYEELDDAFTGAEEGLWVDSTDAATLFQERTGGSATTPSAVDDPVGTRLDKSGNNNHQTAPSDAARPLRRDTPVAHIEYDETDDYLEATFASAIDGDYFLALPVGLLHARLTVSSGIWAHPKSSNTGIPDNGRDVGVLVRDGTLNATEIAAVKDYYARKGSSGDFAGVTDMSGWFWGRSDIGEVFVGDWDVSSVTNFKDFIRGSSVTALDVSSWDVSSVENFAVFAYASNLTSLDVSNWDTSNVTDFAMFIRATNIASLDISGWDLSNVTTFSRFADGSSVLTTINCGSAFDNTPCTNFTNAFRNTNLTQAAIDAILVSIENAGTSNGTFDQSGGNAPSSTGEAAIDALRARGWTVTVTGGY